MARIAGVDLPREKRIEIGLTYIFGIGRPTARKILEEAGVNPDERVNKLSDEDINKLRRIIDASIRVEGVLRSEIARNIKRLMDIGSSRRVGAVRGGAVGG